MKLLATFMLCSMLVGSPAAADDPPPPMDDATQEQPEAETTPATKPTETDGRLSIKLEAPTAVTIGDIGEATLSITGGEARDIDWRFDPKPPKVIFNAGRTRCYFAPGRKELTYTIDVAVAGKLSGIARQTTKVTVAYAEGVIPKRAAAGGGAEFNAKHELQRAADNVQTMTREQDIADLVAVLNAHSSVREAKAAFATRAGARAPAWNPYWVELEALISYLKAKGQIPSVEYVRGAMQEAAKQLEAGS